MLRQLEDILGNCRFEPVRLACEAALQKDPEAGLSRHILGLIELWSGRIQEGRQLLCPAITQTLELEVQNDKNGSMAVDAARLRAVGHLDQAIAIWMRRLILSPFDPEGLAGIAECLQLLGRLAEAVGFMKALCSVRPEDAQAAYNLGAALLRNREPGEALPFLHRAAHLLPGWGAAWMCLAMALLQNSQHAQAVQALNISRLLAPEDLVSLSQQILCLHYCPETLQKDLPDAYAQCAALLGPPPAPADVALTPGQRIRIGYVSGDLREHPVSFFLEPLLLHHDREAFEIFAYSTNPKVDSTTERLRTMVSHWREIFYFSAEAFVDQVRRDGIHVLVDLSGHTPMNQLRAFAKRPAPVQVTMIGTMLSTGVGAIDYRVTDAFMDAEGVPAHWTERAMLFNTGPVVFQPPGDFEIAPSPVSKGRPFTFGSLNDPAKVTDDNLAVWAHILRRTLGSRILLVRRPMNPMKQKLESMGIAGDRILERDYQPLPDFLKMLAEVDLALDPFPYNGLTVTLQSCWMGVPPVTLLGKTPPSRAAAMVLARMGLNGFIAENQGSYIDKAVAFFQDPSALVALRPRMRELTQAAWCQGEAYTREFEDNLVKALAERQSGEGRGHSG